MKHFPTKALAAALVTMLLFSASAFSKRVVVPEMYLFGMAASFNDTIVHFTDIQRVDSAWILKKKNFLQSRDVYSKQLREHMEKTHNLPHRTCIIFFNTNRTKLEKKFIKMRRLYTESKDGKQHFDVHYLPAGEFTFKSVDLTGLDDIERAQEIEDAKQAKLNRAAEKEQQKLDKQARKQAKKDRKAARRQKN